MKYTVEMSCGHKEEINLIGKIEEREKKIRYYKQYGLCKKCYAEKINRDNSNGCNEVKMTYADYKNLCPEYKTKRNSYCADDKTVVVYVPVGDRSMNIDIDDLGARQIKIGKYDGYISITENDIILVWTDKSFSYSIVGNASESDIIRMANSVKLHKLSK